MCDCKQIKECVDLKLIEDQTLMQYKLMLYSKWEGNETFIFVIRNNYSYLEGNYLDIFRCGTGIERDAIINPKCNVVKDLYCVHNNIYLTVEQCQDIFIFCDVHNLAGLAKYLQRIGFEFK